MIIIECFCFLNKIHVPLRVFWSSIARKYFSAAPAVAEAGGQRSNLQTACSFHRKQVRPTCSRCVVFVLNLQSKEQKVEQKNDDAMTLIVVSFCFYFLIFIFSAHRRSGCWLQSECRWLRISSAFLSRTDPSFGVAENLRLFVLFAAAALVLSGSSVIFHSAASRFILRINSRCFAALSEALCTLVSAAWWTHFIQTDSWVFYLLINLFFLCLDNDYDLSYRRHSFIYFFRSEKIHFKVFGMAF